MLALPSSEKRMHGFLRKQSLIRCVHCRQPLTDETRDHVFPTSWYPETTTAQVQRWTVPSCRDCNNKLSTIEKRVFNRLALCVDPRKLEAAGLSAKALRSMAIGRAGSLGSRETKHRQANKHKIMSAISPYQAGTETLPGLGLHPGFCEERQMQIRIPADMLLEVARKIVRGCEYALASRIVEEPYEIKIYFVHERNIPDALSRVFADPRANTTNLGPGFTLTRAAAPEEPEAVMYKIIVWGALVFYASILPGPGLGDDQLATS